MLNRYRIGRAPDNKVRILLPGEEGERYLINLDEIFSKV